MERVEKFGRIVYPITSYEGQLDYYEHLNYWSTCVHNTNQRIVPTKEDAEEYARLKAEKSSIFGDFAAKRRCRKLQVYENRYDWRPTKSGDGKFVGLQSPTGEQLLPNYFADVFTQFDSISSRPNFIPVSNGDGWALVSLGIAPVLVTEFRYNAIIPERWERRIFFVQDKETLKWGAMRVVWPSVNDNKKFQQTLPCIVPIMPCIADEIYEDELMTEEEPTLFFMTRIGEKIGFLTDWGYSSIAFDRYEVNDDTCRFRLIRNDKKRAVRADWWHPDGKDLFINIKLRYRNAEKKTPPSGQI